jgi:hypothetical protein
MGFPGYFFSDHYGGVRLVMGSIHQSQSRGVESLSGFEKGAKLRTSEAF